MPKLKTLSSVTKRFKITASKKFLRHQAGKNHLLQKKTSTRKQKLSKVRKVKQQDNKKIKAQLLL